MPATNNLNKYFTSRLLSWHHAVNDRDLPWKKEKDPYRIWLSEVILQQTRALQGLPYYLRFTSAYPTIQDMAAAPDEEVFRLWQGLGYYNRCKNMLATARYISSELNGIFPVAYSDLIQLKGIGSYTAAAIASFAYGGPHAVVDGNVYRVLARFFRLDTPFDTPQGKKEFTARADELLDATDSAAYNQAIMDLGATICTPRKPLCGQCPLQEKCGALQAGIVALLPVRSKKINVKQRFFHYLLLHHNGRLWIHKRTGKDIWENLHEPYLIEAAAPLDAPALQTCEDFSERDFRYTALSLAGTSKQKLTHQLIEARFFRLELSQAPALPGDMQGQWLDAEQLKKTAFPKTVLSFLEKNLYF